MREAVLAQKISSKLYLEEFGESLRGLCKGLRVDLTSVSLVENNWVKVNVCGEDEKAAVSFLEKTMGLAPINLRNVERFSILRGRAAFSGRSRERVFVDVGVFSPRHVYAVLPLQRLQGQLVSGREFTLERIVELFGLVDDFPLEVRVIKADVDELDVELTEKQLELYSRWIGSRVDRLVVLGALGRRVREAVWKARLRRDVVGVESLGILEHAVVCKLGTDGAGLVPILGRHLLKENFVAFCPRRVLKLTGAS